MAQNLQNTEKPFKPTAVFTPHGIKPTVATPWRDAKPPAQAKGGLTLRERVERMRNLGNSGSNAPGSPIPRIPPATTDEVADATMPDGSDKLTSPSQALELKSPSTTPATPIPGRPAAFERVKGFREDSKAGKAFDTAGNILDQTKRVVGGVAQGAAKMVGGALAAASDASVAMQTWLGNGFTGVAGMDLDTQKAIAAQEHVTSQILGASNSIDQGVQGWTDTRVAPPETLAAEVMANVSDQVGEAIPGVALTAATGGNVLVGNAASYIAAGSKAYGQERMGGGSAGEALLSGVIEGGTEALGGRMFANAPGVQKPLGEGVEEMIAGIAHAMFGGKEYSAEALLADFAYGTVIGGILGGASSTVDAVSTSSAGLGSASTKKAKPLFPQSQGESSMRGAFPRVSADSVVPVAEASPDTTAEPDIAAPAETSPDDGGMIPPPRLPATATASMDPDGNPSHDGDGINPDAGMPGIETTMPGAVEAQAQFESLVEEPDIEGGYAPNPLDALPEVDSAGRSLRYDNDIAPEEVGLPREADLEPETQLEMIPLPERPRENIVTTIEAPITPGELSDPERMSESDRALIERTLAEVEQSDAEESANLLREADELLVTPEAQPESAEDAAVAPSQDVTVAPEQADNSQASDIADTETELERELSPTVQTQPALQTTTVAEPASQPEIQVQPAPDVQPATQTQTRTETQTQTSTASQVDVQSSVQTSIQPAVEAETETQAQLASSIWTPTAVAVKKRERPQGIAPDITRGQGSLGQIYATRGYNTTFGMRSTK